MFTTIYDQFMAVMESFLKEIKRVRVSSVLNKDVKQFGKQFLFDGKDETCWNSSEIFWIKINNLDGSDCCSHLGYYSHTISANVTFNLLQQIKGSPQWILIDFERPLYLEELVIRFQGGFAALEFSTESIATSDPNGLRILQKAYPSNDSSQQRFPLPNCPHSQLKVVFNISADFYGRITIYELDVVGYPECQL